jgi:hypothetical protein
MFKITPNVHLVATALLLSQSALCAVGPLADGRDPNIRSVVEIKFMKGNSVDNMCSGVVLENNIVLTASHCQQEDGEDSTQIVFTNPVTGSVQTRYANFPHGADPYAGKEVTDIESSWRAQMGGDGYGGDFRAITFLGGLPVGSQPAKILPKAFSLPQGTVLSIYGYGDHAAFFTGPGDVDDELRIAVGTVAQSPDQDDDVPDANHNPIGFDTSAGGNMICSGDSGGPAFVKIGSQSYLVGLISTITSGFSPCGTSGNLSNISGFDRDQSDLAIRGNSSSLMNMVNQVLASANPVDSTNYPDPRLSTRTLAKPGTTALNGASNASLNSGPVF